MRALRGHLRRYVANGMLALGGGFLCVVLVVTLVAVSLTGQHTAANLDLSQAQLNAANREIATLETTVAQQDAEQRGRNAALASELSLLRTELTALIAHVGSMDAASVRAVLARVVALQATVQPAPTPRPTSRATPRPTPVPLLPTIPPLPLPTLCHHPHCH